MVSLDYLTPLLLAEIDRLYPDVHTHTAQRAKERLIVLAKGFPAFFEYLVEPFIQGSVLEKTIQNTLESCAYIHLYARVLDDALDENLPIHRLTLLNIQPLFWAHCSQLGATYPTLLEPMRALMEETILAVKKDDRQPTPSEWGRKNHHLLLAPLLLSQNSPTYQASREGLSSLIALAQGLDEWEQGDMACGQIQTHFLQEIETYMADTTLQPLHAGGWHLAIQRIFKDVHYLIDFIEKKGKSI